MYMNLNKLLMLVLSITFISREALSIELKYQNFDALSTQQQSVVKSWIEYGVLASENTLGPLSQDYVPVKLKPRYFAFEPVPWATVNRGNPDGIELHFNRYAAESTLKKDWTLYHEIAHLYHPLLNYEDFWISEGLATYLQNITMLENGIISYHDFKNRLWSGLSRGKQQTKSKQGKLSSVSSNMWSLRAQQRVYWSGVAFFIEAEIALKSKTPSAPSVAQLIKQYQLYRKDPTQDTNHFISKLDQLSHSAVFTNLYRKYIHRKDFPIITRTQIDQLRH
ncbi:M61 family metallopeptidase [Pseudoalteromonas aurantia]|nr:hypothetical protein [Pseudoalteromonas aurantia]